MTQKKYLKKVINVGKFLSEGLIFASTNPQYDDRLLIELQVQSIYENSKFKPGETMLCTEIFSDIQKNFCTQHVLHMFCKKKSFWQRFTCTEGSNHSKLEQLRFWTNDWDVENHFNKLEILVTILLKSRLFYREYLSFSHTSFFWLTYFLAQRRVLLAQE